MTPPNFMTLSPPAVVLTDLDASLLNHDDYRFDAAIPTIERLKTLGIPLVLASSKTAVEMEAIAAEIGTEAPMICENGGGVHFPDGRVEFLGVRRGEILDILDGLRSRFAFRSFEDMGVDGIAKATGLDLERAGRALRRVASEPMLIDNPDDVEPMARALGNFGLTLIRGGRFFHVAGPTDKGRAGRLVVRHYRDSPAKNGGSAFPVIAVGDSPNDREMLAMADYAILVPGPNGPKMTLDHANLTIAPQPGAAGWAAAVDDVLMTLIK